MAATTRPGTSLRSTLESFGSGKVARLYSDGIINVMTRSVPAMRLSTGAVIEIFSDLAVVTGAVIEIDSFVRLPPKIYPASRRKP